MGASIVTLYVTFKSLPVTGSGLALTGTCAIYSLMSAGAKIGRTIRRIREAQGLTAEDLGDALGLSKVEITRKELGKSAITLDQLETIARTLNYPLPGLVREAMGPGDAESVALVASILALNADARANLLAVVQQMIAKPARRRGSRSSK